MYVDQSQVAAFAEEFDALSSEGQESVVEAASRLFDNLVGVRSGFFDAYDAGGFTDRTYYGDGTAYLRLDPYIALDTDPVAIVSGDDTALTVPEYHEQNGFLVIKNYAAGVPIRPSNFLYRSAWPSDNSFTYGVATAFTGWQVNQKITVSAQWGFAEVPADVKQAVIQLAIHLWRTGDPAFTTISQSGQPYTPPAIPVQAQLIVDQYRAKYTRSAVFA